MTAWLVLILTLAAPAFAQVNGRVSLGEVGPNTGQAGAVSPVPAIGAAQLGALSPASLGGSLSGAPSAPVLTIAAPAAQDARVAPVSALAAQPVVAAAAESKAAATVVPAALAPSAAKTQIVPEAVSEGVAAAAAPLPALEGAARVAADSKSSSFAAVFDGEKSRSPSLAAPAFERVDGISGRNALGRPTPGLKPGHKGSMPAGVVDAFAKAAIVVTGATGLSAYLWSFIHTVMPAMTGAQFLASFLPLTMLPVHFALVAAFWWGRYYRYPFLSPAGRARFRSVAEAVAIAYPAAALAALGLWTASLFGHVPAFLSGVLFPWSAAMGSGSAAMAAFVGILAVLALISLAEVMHHFVWRAPSKTTGGRGGVWGNIGQQLLRMRRKP